MFLTATCRLPTAEGEGSEKHVLVLPPVALRDVTEGFQVSGHTPGQLIGFHLLVMSMRNRCYFSFLIFD